MIRDVFGRELMIGDVIVCFPHSTGKNICIETVSGFWGKDGYEVGQGFYKLKSEFIILKRADRGDVAGKKYFDNEGLPFNCWHTSYKDKHVL